MTVRILEGTTERIQTPEVSDKRGPLTGLTTVVLAIQRVSDSYWLDFNDLTFKNAGWTTRQQQMAEVSATLAPGQYYHDLDTSALVNSVENDTYLLRVDETSGQATNAPYHGQLAVNQWLAELHGRTQL